MLSGRGIIAGICLVVAGVLAIGYEALWLGVGLLVAGILLLVASIYYGVRYLRRAGKGRHNMWLDIAELVLDLFI